MKKIDKFIRDAMHYLVGHFRYFLYYSILDFVLLNHIQEQIDYRIRSMNPVCFAEGSCIKCGCRTTELQMCNKSCDGNCYPRMLNKTKWKKMKLGEELEENETRWKLSDCKFVKI